MKTMLQIYKTIKPVIISFLLGCIAYYVFVCFTGVVLAFFNYSGFDSYVVHNLINRLSGRELKLMAFSIYSSITPIMVCFGVLFLATYFLSKFLSQKIIINSFILTFGAICTDIFYFFDSPFFSAGGSIFFTYKSKIIFLNVIGWCLSTMAVIYLGSLLYSRRAQPANTADRLRSG
jgi:hypothetical protein